MSRNYDLEFRLERARRLVRALHKKGWTQEKLAEKAGYDEKTIRNVLRGEPVRDRTIVDVSKALDVEPELEQMIEHVDVADDEFGGYNRSTYRMYESFYSLYRRSYSQPGAIFRSLLKITWDAPEEHFVFAEYYIHGDGPEATLREHTGPVYMSAYTNLVHFLTTFQGSVRLATMTKMREGDGIMRGSILTQFEGFNFFQPTVSSLVLKRLKSFDLENEAIDYIKLIDPSAPDYRFAEDQLNITEQQLLKVVFRSNFETVRRRASDDAASLSP